VILARVVRVELVAPAARAVPVARAQVVQAASVGAALVDREVLAAMAQEVQVAPAARSLADVAGAAARAAPSMAMLEVQVAGADVEA
jgi:hypothetical protein